MLNGVNVHACVNVSMSIPIFVIVDAVGSCEDADVTSTALRRQSNDASCFAGPSAESTYFTLYKHVTNLPTIRATLQFHY